MKNLVKKYIDRLNIVHWLLVAVLVGSVIQYILFPGVRLNTDRLTYLHYNAVKFNIFLPGKYRDMVADIKVRVFKDGKSIETLDGGYGINMKFSSSGSRGKGDFFIPFGARDGLYTARAYMGDRPLGWPARFRVESRLPAVNLERPLKVMTLESARELRRFNIETPDGTMKGYEGIFDWISYMGGNTLWYMAGQTAAYRKDYLTRDLPWVRDNLAGTGELAAAAAERNVKFGAWVSCFRYVGVRAFKPDWYSYSYKYDRRKDEVYQTYGISINDPRRINDIIKLVKRLNENEDIDYIGLDYIRPAGGGLELVDDFTASMNIELPGEWENYTKKERMAWLGRIVTRSTGRDIPIINKWNWWRAQRVSKIIKQIRQEVNLKKPLWVFVLSWEIGHQHGQDPIMFQDAGADLIAVMMYQADARQFNYFVNEWKEYVEGRKINILPGNQFDWPLHQYSVMPSGPEEYQRRLIKSIEYLKPTGNLKGIFINDFSRALWGRKGPYSTKEWLMAAAKGYSRLDSENGKLEVSLILPPSAESGKFIEGQIRIKNISDSKALNILITLEAAVGLGLPFKEKEIETIKPGAEFVEDFKVGVEGLAGQHMGRYMVAARVREGERIYTSTDYIWIKNIDLDRYIEFR